MSAQDVVRMYASPQLSRPYMVAAWSGMGAVALLAANFLRQELDARLLGEIDPYPFFSPSQVLVQDGLFQELEFPDQKLYYWKRGEGHDLVLLIGTEQPDNTHDMAGVVLDTAQQLGVERIYTGAALAMFMHHAQFPQVWGTVTHPELLADLETHHVRTLEQGSISGLNGLLLPLARERGIQGVCLLGELPVYATQLVNPRATRAVLGVLAGMLHLDLDLTKLEPWIENIEPQLDRLYRMLPEHAQEAIASRQDMPGASQPAAAHADQPLVANEQFFAEIERYLKDHDHPDVDSDEAPEDASDITPDITPDNTPEDEPDTPRDEQEK